MFHVLQRGIRSNADQLESHLLLWRERRSYSIFSSSILRDGARLGASELNVYLTMKITFRALLSIQVTVKELLLNSLTLFGR